MFMHDSLFGNGKPLPTPGEVTSQRGVGRSFRSTENDEERPRLDRDRFAAPYN